MNYLAMNLVLIFLLLKAGSIPSAFSSSQFEQDYYREIYTSGFTLQNTLCDATTMSVVHQTAVCQDLFQRFVYGTLWNAHLNKQAFASLDHPSKACVQQTISWKTRPLGQFWKPNLLTCYSQHIPIRTSNIDDDHYESFFLTSGLDTKQMYLFTKSITATGYEIVLLSKYTLNEEPTRNMLILGDQELEEDKQLNTIETRNFDILEIEMIYTLDMVQQTDQFQHPLQHMDRGRLITVCFSVFQDIIDLYHGGTIDIDAMYAAEQIQKNRQVVFQFPLPPAPNKQLMFSCPGIDLYGRKMNTMALRGMFYMSPGRRPFSIFAYKHVGVPDQVKLIFYVENFDFKNLTPSFKSERQTRTSNQKMKEASTSANP